MNSQKLPVRVANITPGSPPATKKAHYMRLLEDLPHACEVDRAFDKYGLKGTLSKPIVTHSDRDHEGASSAAEARAKQAMIRDELRESCKKE